MATHAAPAVQGVTRVGLGIILELISLSMHELHEAGQLVSESEWVKMRMHPPPQPKCTGGQGLPPVYVPLPVGPPLFEIREKEERLWCVFFSLLIDSSAVGACSSWERICNASLPFSSAAIKKFDIHNEKANFTFNNPLQFKWVDKFVKENSPTAAYTHHNYHINHYQAWWLWKGRPANQWLTCCNCWDAILLTICFKPPGRHSGKLLL